MKKFEITDINGNFKGYIKADERKDRTHNGNGTSFYVNGVEIAYFNTEPPNNFIGFRQILL